MPRSFAGQNGLLTFASAAAVSLASLGALGCAAVHADPLASSPAATAPAEDRRDEPARVDGRVEPTINSAVPAYTGEPARLALIEAAAKLRAELQQKFPPPLAVCRRTPEGSVRIDGRLDEPAWANAATIRGFRQSRTGEPAKLDTRVRMLWDAKYLYFGFDCDDTDVAAEITAHDGDLWKEDVAEVFINPTGDEASYVEFEVSANGTFYDASIAEYRPEVNFAVDSPHLDMMKTIRVFRAKDSPHAARVEGTLNDSSDTDRGWTCELAVSWSDLARGTNAGRLPPRDGDRWRMGIYRINVKSHGNEDEYGAWNPTMTWFHRPWCFGRVLFTDAAENPRTAVAATRPATDATPPK